MFVRCALVDGDSVKQAYNHWRKESQKFVKSIGFGAEESSDEDGAEDLDSRGHHAQKSSMGFWQNQLDTLTANGNEKVEELERQLAAASQEIERLKTTVAQQHAVSTQIGAIPEDDLLRRREMNGSTAVSQMVCPLVLEH